MKRKFVVTAIGVGIVRMTCAVMSRFMMVAGLGQVIDGWHHIEFCQCFEVSSRLPGFRRSRIVIIEIAKT